MDGSESSSKDFWPKTRKIVNDDYNTVHEITSPMDGDFYKGIDELVYVGPKCNKTNPTFNPIINV